MIAVCLLFAAANPATAQKQNGTPCIRSFRLGEDTTGNFRQAGRTFYRLSGCAEAPCRGTVKDEEKTIVRIQGICGS